MLRLESDAQRSQPPFTTVYDNEDVIAPNRQTTAVLVSYCSNDGLCHAVVRLCASNHGRRLRQSIK